MIGASNAHDKQPTSAGRDQGASRSTTQPSPARRNRSRSCRRFGRPCQNSTVSGTTRNPPQCGGAGTSPGNRAAAAAYRSEEHTSELQSRENLVCRLLLEKKKNKQTNTTTSQ